MNDLATLGIAVDSSPAAKATIDLDKMTSAAERAEDAVVELGDKSSTALKAVGKGASSLPGALKEVETSAIGAGKAAIGMVSPQLINQMNQFEASLRSGAKSTGELEMQRSQLRNLQKANMIDEAEAIKINKQLDKTQQDLSKSAVQQEKAMEQLMRSIDPTAAKIAKLERETEQLGKLFDKGGIDAEEYARALGQLDAKFAKLGAANDPINETTGALGRLGLGSRQAREDVMQLGNALAAGDWQGVARNALQLGSAAGSAAAGMLAAVAPAAALVAVVGAIGVAYFQGSKEADAYNQALILTGNAAGTSAKSLGSMAANVSASVGTVSAASAVLAQLANSSKIPASSFEMIATAALKMEDATGQAASKTVADFEKLAKDPVKYSKELNDQLGYLTAGTYEQIAALVKQGDQQGAANLAEKAYADAMTSRADLIKSKLGLIETAWGGVKSAAKSAWDAVLDIGREDTFEQKLIKLEDRLQRIRNAQIAPTVFDDNPNLGELASGEDGAQRAITDAYVQKTEDERRLAAKKAVNDAVKDSIDSQESLNAALRASDAPGKKLADRYAEIEKQIEAARVQGVFYSDAQIKQLRDAAAEQFKGPKAASAGAVDLSVFNDAENQLKAVVAQYDRSKKELDSLQKAGLVSQEDYSRQSATLIRAEKDEVAAAYQAEITALEAAKAKKGTSAAQSIQLDQKIADARANMTKAIQDADSKLNVLQVNEQGRLKKQEVALKAYTDSLNDQIEAVKRQHEAEIAGAGMGDEARKRLQEDMKIREEYAKQITKLARDFTNSDQSPERKKLLDDQTAALKQALADRLAEQKDYYRQVEIEQSNWLNGAKSAFATYVEEAQNVAGQTKSAFLSAFDSLEDVFVKFITTGKASFKDFADSVLADLARIVVKQQVIAPLLNAVFGGGGSSGASSFGGAVGSMLSDNGSGSSTGGWGGMVGLGKNLYSAWNAVTGVGAEIASGYASGGIGGAISGGAGYYGNMLSNIATTLSSGFTSLIGGNIAITGATAASTAATTAALTGVTAEVAASTAATVGAEGITAAALQGAIAEGAASVGTNIGVAGATTAAASQGLAASISSALSSAAAMWPLAIVMGMYQSGKLYDAGVRPDAGEMLDSGGHTAFGKATMAPLAIQSGIMEMTDKINSKLVGGKLAAIISGSTLHQAVWGAVGKKLFGGAWETKDGGISLGVDDGEFDAQQYIYQKKKGGLFSSSKKRTRYSELDAETEDALGAAYNEKILNSMGLFSALGVQLSESVIDGLNVAATKISTQGKTPAAIQEELDKWFTGLGDSAVSAINAATNSGLENYNFEALTTFVNNLYSVNDSFDMLGLKLYDVSVSTGFMAEQLLSMAGGMEAFQTATSTFFDNFYTDVEKADYTLATVNKQFAAMGVTLPGTRDAYRDMVEALDLTTESGRQMYVTLTSLSGNAAQAYSILEQRADAAAAAVQAMSEQLIGVAGSAQSAVQRAISAQQKAATEAYNARVSSLNDMVSTATENVTGLTSVSNNLGAALKALRGDSDDAVKMLRAQAQATLQSALSTARSGGSLSGFTGLEDALETVSNNNTDLYSSMEDFARDQGRTANVVAELNGINGKQLTTAEKSLAGLKEQIDLAKAAYDAQMAQYDSQLAFAQAEMDALNGVDNSVMGVTAAINAMNLAVVAALAGITGKASNGTSTNNGTLIDSVYQSLLGREADAAGKDYWQGQLASGAISYDQLAQAIANAAKEKGQAIKVPGYANGGAFGGGLRLVGENGPELEVTGPSRIYNANQTASMLKGGGDNGALLSEMRMMREENKAQRFQIAKTNQQVASLLQKWDTEGAPKERDYAI